MNLRARLASVRNSLREYWSRSRGGPLGRGRGQRFGRNPGGPLGGSRSLAFDPGVLPRVPEGGYLVGGAVRDALLERESRDFDWLVPDAREYALAAGERSDRHPFPLDEERGHWRLVLDGETHDFVTLSGSVEDDLRNRDFTVNALAIDDEGEIIDVQDGLQDLKRKRLRMTSEQALREDPLRLLRAVRLAAQLEFEIEESTLESVREATSELTRGSLPLPAWERIRDELDGMLLSSNAGRALARLEDLGLLQVLLPELAAARGVEQPGLHHLDVLDHSLEAVQRLVTGFPDADLPLRWATLLHDVGKPMTSERGDDGRLRFYGHDKEGARIAHEICERLRRPSREVDRISNLVRYHMLPLPKGEKEALRFVHRRRQLLPDLLKLMIADREAARGPLSSEANRRSYRIALSRIVEILEEEPPPEPLLDGSEVMEQLDLGEGPEVGEALRFLAEARAVGDIEDREQAKVALERFARARGWLE